MEAPGPSESRPQKSTVPTHKDSESMELGQSPMGPPQPARAFCSPLKCKLLDSTVALKEHYGDGPLFRAHGRQAENDVLPLLPSFWPLKVCHSLTQT